MRGGKNPLVVELTSSCADAAGVVVPIPTRCAPAMLINNKAIIKKTVLFILFFFMKIETPDKQIR
jgi:hypothetical protein